MPIPVNRFSTQRPYRDPRELRGIPVKRQHFLNVVLTHGRRAVQIVRSAPQHTSSLVLALSQELLVAGCGAPPLHASKADLGLCDGGKLARQPIRVALKQSSHRRDLVA